MSVGGDVIEVLPWNEKGHLWVNTLDRHEQCAVICDPLGEDVRVGDALWWSCGYCLWTPRGRDEDIRSDVKLRKVGFSGVSRPKAGT